MEQIGKEHTINQDATILDALKALNSLSDSVLTLFVVDGEGRVLGTLTDGDIRRSLVKGQNLEACVRDVMNTNFYSVRGNELIVEHLKELRRKDIDMLPVLDESGRIRSLVDIRKKKSILPVDAVLMAGGKGERLRPLTEKTPKPLLKVGDKSIIDYNIDSLIEYGVDNINVTINYLGDQLEEHFAEPRNGCKVKCVREPKYLGTIGSVKFIEDFRNDTVLIMNSDLFTNINYEDFFMHFREHDADMSVATVPYTVSVPYGICDLDERRITRLIEKPTYNYYINSGIYLIKREVIDQIPDDTFFNATDLIETLIAVGKNVIRFPLIGYWIDIGKHEDYKKAQEFVKHL